MLSSTSPSPKKDVPNLVICVDRSYVFERYAIRCYSKKRHENDMCAKEIGVHAQNMITFLAQ